MNNLILIIIGAGLLGLLYLFQIIYSLFKKREEINQNWQGIAHLMQERIDLIPYLIETFQELAPEEKSLIDKAIRVRAEAIQKNILPHNCQEKEIALDEILKNLLLSGEKHPKLSNDVRFLEAKQGICHLTFSLKHKIKNYNKKVLFFNRLRFVPFFSSLFKIKSLQEMK